ncbi:MULTISPECIES: hypothetical protein [Bradyrhizobium]|uniref:HEPN AbiU2-like domain-containing protein n=1 Tax=Bradyrhizobium ottawaense TaxID=931866 RepID=A0ABV4FIX7_9BRAD|nr:hypothetical protein [Bradyrhizobium sp. CCBAU 15615]
MNKLSDFIADHRERFADVDTNVFVFAWAKITRRLGFLSIIEHRYLEASAAFIANSQALQALTQPGAHPVTEEQAALHRAALPLVADLHLQIESYYLFAKIILDDVARAIEHYFGSARNLALDSHDDLSRWLPAYAEGKGLTVSKQLLESVADLRQRVSDVRDQKVSHEKSPWTMQGTSWSLDGGGASMVMMRLYPRETDPRQFNSEQLPKLTQAIEIYLDLIVGCIVANEDKTTLKLAEKKVPPEGHS